VDPFGRYAYVTETLFGTVHQYAIDEDGGLVSLGRVFNATNLPGSVTIHPAGTNVYIGSGTISLFSIGADGTLTPMTPPFIVDNGGPTGPDAIDPAGRYLYGTISRGPIGGVTQYRIEADGSLTPLTTVDTGPIPGNMAISP
jgi:6-phosphogluconolactonase (cycloisomerase 2 family)